MTLWFRSPGQFRRHPRQSPASRRRTFQPALQQLLYDVEAGMPFLFVDQLTVQAPQATGAEIARMRVLIGVSGQWQGTR